MVVAVILGQIERIVSESPEMRRTLGAARTPGSPSWHLPARGLLSSADSLQSPGPPLIQYDHLTLLLLPLLNAANDDTVTCRLRRVT